MFSEIGFQIAANIPWDKGHIEGNRNFNQGNFSPYYQALHNCWEHIFVFSKGYPQFDLDRLPKILKATPVIKMYNGHNQLGHSAPYPDNIPQLLLDLLTPGAKILDPFSGSMTTGRVAYLNGYESVNIDYKKEYCELGLKLLEKELLSRKQLPLALS
jgi:DNA modification methylase